MNHGTANSTSFRYDLDKLGRMTKVTRNGLPAAKQDVSYTYDMHGWLQKIVTNSFTGSSTTQVVKEQSITMAISAASSGRIIHLRHTVDINTPTI